MNFDFPVRKNLRELWVIYKTHWAVFVWLALGTLALNSIPTSIDALHGVFYLFGTLCLAIIALVWSFLWVRVSLAVAEGEENTLHLGAIKKMLPSGTQLLGLVAIGVLTGAAILIGFVAFIVPGIYVLTRLAFVNLAFVDKKLSPLAAIKYSWRLVTGEKFWTVLLVLIVSMGLIIGGFLLFGIGLVVTYPLAMMLIARLYKALDTAQKE